MLIDGHLYRRERHLSQHEAEVSSIESSEPTGPVDAMKSRSQLAIKTHLHLLFGHLEGVSDHMGLPYKKRRDFRHRSRKEMGKECMRIVLNELFSMAFGEFVDTKVDTVRWQSDYIGRHPREGTLPRSSQ